MAAALLAACACGDPSGPLPVAQLEVHAVPTLVDECDGELTEWTVKVEQTGEHHSRACEEPIVLTALEPYKPYTLDVTGYSARGLCWRGTCAVTPRVGLDVLECGRLAKEQCGDAGGK
jgi:hypothetical protein